MRTDGWMRRREIVAISDKETFIAMLQMQDLLAKSMRDFASKSCICNIAIKVSLSDMATLSRRRIQPPVRTAGPPH